MSTLTLALDRAAAQHLTAATQVFDAGQTGEAAARLAPLRASHPDHPDVLRLHAGILARGGDIRGALAAIRRALELCPDVAQYHAVLGSILGAAGELDAAIAALRRVCALQPVLANAWYNLGIVLVRAVRLDEAEEALRRTLALAPAHHLARGQLADLLKLNGRPDEAAAAYRQLLAERPWAGMAWWGLADIKTLRFTGGDIECMHQAWLDPRASDEDRVTTGFALAKALDDEGRCAEALDALMRANAIPRLRGRWHEQAFVAEAEATRVAFAPPPVGAAQGELGRGVIFIVSLPRSGSTLIEQILASHPAVEGAGELPDLPRVLAEESARRRSHYPQWAQDLHPADWQRLGERYMERTARWRKHRSVFTDKMPGNWMHIGAIRAMLPAAKIVVCRRDPLETCFACYRQYLTQDNNGWTRRFEDLAAYWHRFDRDVRHWRALHPGHVHEHVYEDLQTDPERSVRALLDACGLPFDPACLRFNENTRTVRSPSAMQVRQPLRRDTARTPRYGALLDPLRVALGLAPYAG